MYHPVTISPVERERLRERDREARAQMVYEAESRGAQDGANSGPLFGEIVRVNPKSTDFERQHHIERKLGKFDDVKHLLADQDVTNLFGIDGQPPPSPAPAPNMNKSSLMSHEFKKPNVCSQSQQNRSSHHHRDHHHSSSSQRGGFVKPADGKPAYSGRGHYPGQPMKHSSSSSNDFRGSGLVPGKGPPVLSGSASTSGSINANFNSHHSSSSSRSAMHEFSSNSSGVGGNSSSNGSTGTNTGGSNSNSNKMHGRALSKLVCELSSNNGNGVSQANVENILDEMTSRHLTPLTAIAATPRKEKEVSNFKFNTNSGMMESISKPPVLDKNSRTNALNSILGLPGSRFTPTPVFKPGQASNLFLPPSNLSSHSTPAKTKLASSSTSSCGSATNSGAANTTSGCGNGFGSGNSGNGNNVNSNVGLTNSSNNSGGTGGSVPTLTSSASSSNKTTCAGLSTELEEDLSVSSEDSEDENDSCDYEEKGNSNKSKSNNQSVAPKSDTISANKSESVNSRTMSSEEVHDSSSSDDSESDSGSESEDSSSDSPSPPSLPLPPAPDPEDNKSRWNLKNFLPQSHGNSTPAPQTPQACENDVKSKTDDSDSSGDTKQNMRVASSSSSDSDADSDKACEDKHKSSRTTQSDDSSDEDDHSRRNYASRKPRSPSLSSSQSSDDSDRPTPKIANQGSASGANSSTASSVGSNAGSSNSNAVVGVVRPHQRIAPSPQVFANRTQSTADERFSFVQQQQHQQQQPQRSSLQMSTAPEPQCQLPSHSNSSPTVVGGMRRNRISEPFTSRRTATSVSSVKSAEKPAKTSNKGRKPKSPAVVTAAVVEPAPKKKRGRKKIKKVPDSDSEYDEPKVKVPKRKRPGRPPLKRNDNEDDDWNAGPRRKVMDKFQPTNVWGGRESRRSSIRSTFPQDSDSEVEQTPAPKKPIARIPPVEKESGSRKNRDSSCESSKNDSDFNSMPGSGAKNTVTKAEESPPKLDVEGISVQDKKKSDTLRKLFSRREESGGKGGGKGKGGKGKCGVIVMESETERKLERSALSPAPTLHRTHLDIPSRVEISPPQHIVPELSRVQIDNDLRGTSMLRGRGERVPDVNASAAPTIASSKAPLELPKLTYNDKGRPVLMCKIDLSRVPFLGKRSEEMRTKSELSDTRQERSSSYSSDLSNAAPLSLDLVQVPSMLEPLSENNTDNETSASVNRKHAANKKHTKQKVKANKRKHRVKEDPPPPIFTPNVHTPSVDPDSDSLSSDSEPSQKKMFRNPAQRLASMRPPPDPMHNLMNSCYPMTVNSLQESGLGLERRSDDESWLDNCSTCSDSSTRHRSDKYNMRKSLHSKRLSRRKTRGDHILQRHSSLMDSAPPIMCVPGTSHERSLSLESTLTGYPSRCNEMIVRPIVPTHHGIYYSYLEHKVSEEMNSESDNISPNVYLMEAKRLKHAADTERDLVSQGMQYLEAILSFVLTGHVLERRSQIETAFSMYSETLKLIVYISKKFRTLCTNAAPSTIPNKIAILSLRCESILNLKLYTMREVEVRDVHSAVTEYFSKPVPPEAILVANQGIPSPHSPTPSPASSVGSNSSGYSSGDRRQASAAQCVAVSLNLHTALQKQHNFYSNLIASFNYWEEADKLIFSGGTKDFFIELDRFCGPLTLHSSLKDLVHYVRVGIQRLKAIISHHHRV